MRVPPAPRLRFIDDGPTERSGMRGHLIWFNREKCHGFIRTEDGERLLVEQSGFEPGTILGDRCAGTPLTFEREGPNGSVPRAVRASIVPEKVFAKVKLYLTSR